MRALCSSVLAIEGIVVLLATSLATSNGSVSNTGLAWTVGLVLMLLFFLSPAALRSRAGYTLGWVLQVLVLASAVVVGWAMLVVGVAFVALWWAAIHIGSRVEAQRAQADDGG